MSRKNAVDAGKIQLVLGKILDEECMVRWDRHVEFRKTIQIVTLAWDKFIAGGYWDPENQRALHKTTDEWVNSYRNREE